MGSKQSVNEFWPAYIISTATKKKQKTKNKSKTSTKKLRPRN